MSYIDRDAFIKEQRELYCKDCTRRFGVKNGKLKEIYKIGEAPCKSCELNDALDHLDDYPEANVTPVVHAHWVEKGVWVPLARDASPWSYDEDRYDYETHSQKEFKWFCSNCDYEGDDWFKPDWIKYCPNCGAKMDEETNGDKE